ncbi:hypothetical protein [uncultured Microscilla sp.]|uniref:hypothetical protein n=1 Tax=uncultured Microscilla sp. TaxID=432653 RepID=UPI0026221E3E|nr:hypothetical protein [uncultured Microscilla sp.]
MKYLFNTRVIGLAFIACVFACLTACGGGDKDNNTDSADNADTTSKTTTTTSESSNNNTDAGKESEGEQKPVAKLSTNIEDYYKIWVKSFKADMEKQSGQKAQDPEVSVKDIANGFLKIDLVKTGVMGYNTMTLWAAKNGKTTLGVLNHGCGPICFSGTITFYELEGETLKNVTEKVFPVKEQERLQKLGYEKSKSDKEYSYPGNGYWTILPQNGTTVKMGLAKENTQNNNKKEFKLLMAELQYNVADNTFKLVEK